MSDSESSEAARALGRKGGAARAAKLTPAERSAIARAAAKARHAKSTVAERAEATARATEAATAARRKKKSDAESS